MAPSDEGAMRWSKFCNGKKNELPYNFRKSGKHLPTPKTLPVGAKARGHKKQIHTLPIPRLKEGSF